jgi:hypothetical protein
LVNLHIDGHTFVVDGRVLKNKLNDVQSKMYSDFYENKRKEEDKLAIEFLEKHGILNENIHIQIEALLKLGIKVNSGAYCRMGEIIVVHGGSIYIKLKKHNRAVTTFLHGDKVYLTLRDSKWKVLNV